uniref:Ataxin-10 domain-containing protein n=1 Tax=Kalanchoe fedtschenkoi TaxID=63787 RepID=A0A7N0RG15_KALFE
MDQSLWHPLFIAANSHDKTDCLEILIKFSQTMDGRAHLASQNILFPVLKLLESVSYPQDRDLLVSSLKLLRNLCAGNIYNQNLFVELKGVSAILSLLTSVRSSAVLDDGVVRIGLQLLGNVSLAGEEHQRAVWQQLFPTEFAWIAKIQRCNTCDPLCMIIYLCSDGSSEMAVQLFEDQGLSLIAEIIRTTSRVASVDFASRSSSGLPTGSPLIDVLGYSLTLIRDLCAQGDSKDASAEFVDSIISSGLLELLLDLLRQLEPPAIVKKGMDQAGSSSPFPSKLCPYKGFRRDIVGVIGNCAFHRKHVQDYIRKKNGIILLLQQCVTDEENPYLREWGIWSIRNLLEDNLENQKEVADLKIQGAVDVPEISGLGIKLEVDKQTGHARLVNIPT